MVALAEAIGLPFETRQLEFNALCHLGPRLLGHSLASLTESSRAQLLSGPPPDLTISAGHRSVPAVQALRARSGCHTRSIHVGFPRISPAKFSLVIATPQYPIADHPNLVRIPYALTRAVTADADAGDEALLAALLKPRRLLIVGGPTLFWKLDDDALLAKLADLLGEAARDGGSVIVTTSPRTPAELEQRIAQTLAKAEAATLLAKPGKPPRFDDLRRNLDRQAARHCARGQLDDGSGVHAADVAPPTGPASLPAGSSIFLERTPADRGHSGTEQTRDIARR